MNPRIYSDITPERFAAIAAAVQEKAGITISGNVGEASKKGITIAWNYDPAQQVLTLTLEKREWYDPSEQTIDADLDQLVARTA